VDAQLARLGTDYIDVLQLHWPERYTPLWGAPAYDYSLERGGKEEEEEVVTFKEQCEAMHELVQVQRTTHHHHNHLCHRFAAKPPYIYLVLTRIDNLQSTTCNHQSTLDAITVPLER